MTDKKSSIATNRIISSSLSSAHRSGLSACSAFNAACGTSFSQFAELEEEPFQSFLLTIQQQCAEISEQNVALNNSISHALTELVDIPNLMADIVSKEHYQKDVKKRFRSNASQHSSTCAKIAKMKVGTESDRVKLDALKQECEFCFRQQQALIVLSGETEEGMIQEQCFYRHELFLRLLKCMFVFVKERIYPCSIISDRGENILRSVPNFSDLEDLEITELKKLLSDLESEL
jgi:hypothetical protein